MAANIQLSSGTFPSLHNAFPAADLSDSSSRSSTCHRHHRHTLHRQRDHLPIQLCPTSQTTRHTRSVRGKPVKGQLRLSLSQLVTENATCYDGKLSSVPKGENSSKIIDLRLAISTRSFWGRARCGTLHEAHPHATFAG